MAWSKLIALCLLRANTRVNLRKIEDRKHYDIETDCATVSDGNLDECIELPGKQIEMNETLSIVRTVYGDPLITK